MRDEHIRVARKLADWRKILDRIVGNLLHVGHDRDRADRAGPVVDDERLPEYRRELLRHHPRRDISGLAGRPRDDHFDWTVRIALSESGAGCGECKHHEQATDISHSVPPGSVRTNIERRPDFPKAAFHDAERNMDGPCKVTPRRTRALIPRARQRSSPG